MKIRLTFFFFLFLLFTFSFCQSQNRKIANGWYYITEESYGIKLRLDKSNSYYYIDSTPIIGSKNIKKISFQYDNKGNPYLKLQFDAIGTNIWKLATRRYINRKLGFVFNNMLIQAPTVNSEIDSGIAAIWEYSKEELSLIKMILERERNKFP